MADFVYFNPNPNGAKTGDCVVRAIAAATGQDWDSTYTGLTFMGFVLKDLPSANHIWSEYLISRGFKRHVIPNTCPACYTVSDFANDHQRGTYVLGTGTHCVAVIDGKIYDSWDSRNEVPIYYFSEV